MSSINVFETFKNELFVLVSHRALELHLKSFRVETGSGSLESRIKCRNRKRTLPTIDWVGSSRTPTRFLREHDASAETDLSKVLFSNQFFFFSMWCPINCYFRWKIEFWIENMWEIIPALHSSGHWFVFYWKKKKNKRRTRRERGMEESWVAGS